MLPPNIFVYITIRSSQNVFALRDVFIDILNCSCHLQELRNTPQPSHIGTVDLNSEINFTILTINLADLHLAMIPDEIQAAVDDNLFQDILRLLDIFHASENEGTNMIIVHANRPGKDPFTRKDAMVLAAFRFNIALVLVRHNLYLLCLLHEMNKLSIEVLFLPSISLLYYIIENTKF